AEGSHPGSGLLRRSGRSRGVVRSEVVWTEPGAPEPAARSGRREDSDRGRDQHARARGRGVRGRELGVYPRGARARGRRAAPRRDGDRPGGGCDRPRGRGGRRGLMIKRFWNIKNEAGEVAELLIYG